MMTPSDAKGSATNDVTDTTIATKLSSERLREQKESLLQDARDNDVANRTEPPVSFCGKIQTDSIYKQKFFDTVCLWISEFVFVCLPFRIFCLLQSFFKRQFN